LRILKENLGGNFHDTDEGNDRTSKAQATKVNIDKWDSIKLKRFCTVEKTTNRGTRNTYRIGENICKLDSW
jgi:hypothetical protein